MNCNWKRQNVRLLEDWVTIAKRECGMVLNRIGEVGEGQPTGE